MHSGNSFFFKAKPRLVAIFVFFSITVFVSGIRAQTGIPPTRLSKASVLITNLLQLSKLLDESPRIIADTRLDVVVCSASRPQIGVIAVKDETGAEIFALGPRRFPITAGDVLHIEEQHCLLRKRDGGVQITRAPDLDNDGTHGMKKVETEMSLTVGLYPLILEYFNYMGLSGLELTCRLPDGTVQPASKFFRYDNDPTACSNMAAGLKVAYFEGGWLEVPDFDLLQPVKKITTTNLAASLWPQKEFFGIRFDGFFSAPMPGKYVFTLESDDGSLLFLDRPELALAATSHQEVPLPALSSLRPSITDLEATKWISLEGRAVFVSKYGIGLRLELRSQSDSVWVMIADGRNLDAARLLNSRIRVAGIGRVVTGSNRERALGELSVVSADNITILENPKEAFESSDSAPTLVAVEQIQRLSKDEAVHHLPVRVQGVVTSVAPPLFHYMSVQDDTRGIFVRLPAAMGSNPVVGQFCEVAGYTDAGDFAPIIVAQKLTVLGNGHMPVPAHPTWRELINGSMDVQWVELQGLVTSVRSNILTLLLPEGEMNIEAGTYSESQLRAMEKSVIRIRGVLFAAWNTNRTVQVGHLVMRNPAINVDVPAPRDPFDVSLKSWSQLYQFDAGATPFQQVKVRGTTIYSNSKQIFIMDNTRGIRVSPVETTNFQFGEEVEAVGYPDISGSAPLLREAILRRTGKQTAPKPHELSGSELMQENLDSTLVQISGVLVGVRSEDSTCVLEMRTDGQLFLARMPVTKESDSLRIGSRLALAGAYVGKATTWSVGNKPSGFELLLSNPSQLTVLSQPSWWTPTRLLVMVGLLLVFLALAAVWISQLRHLVEQRTRQLQREIRGRETIERERALEAERSRIARDLHDDLGSSLTEIGVLANKGQRLRTLDEHTGLFRSITTKVRGLVTALDTIVWAIDPADNTLESVADYLSDFASEYLSHSGIACRFDIPVALPSIVLEGRLRHDLLAAVNETLNNVVRHAHSTEVEFRMAVAEDQLQIIISDNGKGFDAKINYGGNGLKNLPLRMSKLGGRYGIESAIGKGTIVTIALGRLKTKETLSANM